MAKRSGTEVTRYVYEGSKVTLELDEKYKFKSRNIYGNKLILRKNGTDLLYYLYNAHGDVTGLFDQTGALTASYYYDAFGNVLESNTSKDNPFLYSGYRHDKETGLYYLNARYYDPYIGRFITEDVYPERVNDPLSLNRYTYCLNQPIKYVDPTGYREAVETLGRVTDSASR